MNEAAVQALLPNLAVKPGTGICPAQWFRGAIQRGIIHSASPGIGFDQIQPASIDLRLGSVAYRVKSSFLPGRKDRVVDKLKWLTTDEIDLANGAVLRAGHVYIVPLMEHLSLRKRLSAIANPKSSTGRLDIFARVISDYSTEFDNIAEQYKGPLWVEVAPRSFNVVVRRGSRLVQLRIKDGAPRPTQEQLKLLFRELGVVHDDDDDPDIKKGRPAIRVDIRGDKVSGLVGYRARKTKTPLDVDRVNHYDPSEFWIPVRRPKHGGITLKPNQFHILASKGVISVPEDFAADMIAYDTLVGEFRVHYAGFFDPGFGYSKQGPRGARAVLEVRSHEVPFMIEDGQIVGRLIFEPLTEQTEKPYGSNIGSSYQYQGLALSKQFKR